MKHIGVSIRVSDADHGQMMPRGAATQQEQPGQIWSAFSGSNFHTDDGSALHKWLASPAHACEL